MSEFTVGMLSLRSQATAVATALDGTGLGYKQRSLNPDWTAFFLADELNEAAQERGLEAASRRAPVLWFVSAEDHGWSYRLWQQGREVAALEINYELTFTMASDRFAELYPDQDPFENDETVARWTALREELDRSPAATEAVRAQYQKANPEALGALELTAAQLTELKVLLSPNWGGEDGPWGQVHRFKEILGITEMNWLNYEWAEERPLY
jgi:hypothetical protein